MTSLPSVGPVPHRDLARQLGLAPRLRDVPLLAMVQTRAYGVYSRNKVRTHVDTHSRYDRTRRWRAWVALACWPSLIDLAASTMMGWIAASPSHAFTEIKPVRRNAGEWTGYMLTGAAASIILLGSGVLLAVGPFVVWAVLAGSAWPLVVGYAVLIAPLITGLADQTYRMRNAVARVPPMPLLPAGATYWLAGFCAHPQHGGQGGNLIESILGRLDNGIGPVNFVMCPDARFVGQIRQTSFRFPDGRRGKAAHGEILAVSVAIKAIAAGRHPLRTSACHAGRPRLGEGWLMWRLPVIYLIDGDSARAVVASVRLLGSS